MDAAAVSATRPSETSWRNFARHLIEMVVAMYVGMGAGSLLFAPILIATGITPREARLQFPELYVLVMAFIMTVPMVAWMRHRGHGWRNSSEMAAAMVVPGFFLLCLYWLGLTGGPACSAYCGLMIVAMVGVMLVRRDEYSLDHRHHLSSHEHHASEHPNHPMERQPALRAGEGR